MEANLTDKKTLSILGYLLENKASKNALLAHFTIKPSTLYKHINLIKKAGFEVQIENSIYEIFIPKNLITFAQYELNLLSYLLLLTYIMLPNEDLKHFQTTTNKILSLTSKKDASCVKENYEKCRLNSISQYYSEKISTLKDYQKEKKYVFITTKNKEELKILPIEYNWNKNKLFLEYLDEEHSRKTILIDDIIKINKENKIPNFSNEKETIFELYGKLSKSYLLKEGERIVDFTRDKIVIANCSKDKEALFRRLLRYDTLCKITFPKTDVIKFKNMIEKSLDNIDKFLDNI